LALLDGSSLAARSKKDENLKDGRRKEKEPVLHAPTHRDWGVNSQHAAKASDGASRRMPTTTDATPPR
jgi:hypothetical protein